jgi:flagellar biosynthesis/type III secretory pathway protein FliH
VQIITQDFWDSRALAYASAFYGNQLKRVGAWSELRRVIAINFPGLGKGGTRDSLIHGVRHYVLQDVEYVLQDVENPNEGHVMEGFEPIQYCVPHLHKAARSDETFREWADFFQNADERTEAHVEQLKTEAVKKAYERARVRNMPREIRQSYMDDTAKYGGYLNSIQKERDEVQRTYEALLEAEKRKGEAETRKGEALRCRLVNCALRMLTNGENETTVLTETGLEIVKKQKTKYSGDCLEIIQEEARSSKGRRDHIFAAGYAKGFEEGKESGCALGLAEGLEKGKESAACANATQIASLKATNEALHKQPCDILKQSNGVATGQLIATQPASELVVENRKQNNKIEALEQSVADLTVKLATLKQLNEEQKRLNGEQEKELTVLLRASSNYLGLASTAASVSRPGSSVYIKR